MSVKSHILLLATLASFIWGNISVSQSEPFTLEILNAFPAPFAMYRERKFFDGSSIARSHVCILIELLPSRSESVMCKDRDK